MRLKSEKVIHYALKEQVLRYINVSPRAFQSLRAYCTIPSIPKKIILTYYTNCILTGHMYIKCLVLLFETFPFSTHPEERSQRSPKVPARVDHPDHFRRAPPPTQAEPSMRLCISSFRPIPCGSSLQIGQWQPLPLVSVVPRGYGAYQEGVNSRHHLMRKSR